MTNDEARMTNECPMNQCLSIRHLAIEELVIHSTFGFRNSKFGTFKIKNVLKILHFGLSFSILIFAFYIYNVPCAFAAKGRNVTARSAVVMDLDNKKVIYARNPNLKLAPASTTKLVTALVVLDRLGLNDIVQISKDAASVVPSKANLKAGASYKVQDLLCALLISSANDAAVALAEAASGSEAEFAKLMNDKARSLGANSSNFLTASGLPKKGQYSTAFDLALIAGKALSQPLIKETLSKKYVWIVGSDGRRVLLKNHNKLLWRMPSPVVLGKTGYTAKAKHCFAGVADCNNRRVAIAVLKSRRPWYDIRAILFD